VRPVTRIGISVHDSLMTADPARRRAILSRAEQAGLDYACVADHVSFHGGTGFDGLASATAALSSNDRLPVLVGIYLLGLRHPVLTARQLASISQLAPGRLILGVGAGGEDRAEVSNSGVDPATRGRRLDECLQVLRELAAGQAVDHQGEFFTLAGARILPAPVPAAARSGAGDPLPAPVRAIRAVRPGRLAGTGGRVAGAVRGGRRGAPDPDARGLVARGRHRPRRGRASRADRGGRRSGILG
jgi:hypothetical protein